MKVSFIFGKILAKIIWLSNMVNFRKGWSRDNLDHCYLGCEFEFRGLAVSVWHLYFVETSIEMRSWTFWIDGLCLLICCGFILVCLRVFWFLIRVIIWWIHHWRIMWLGCFIYWFQFLILFLIICFIRFLLSWQAIRWASFILTVKKFPFSWLNYFLFLSLTYYALCRTLLKRRSPPYCFMLC